MYVIWIYCYLYAYTDIKVGLEVSFAGACCSSSLRSSVCLYFLKTFLSFSTEPLGQFQPNTKHFLVKGIYVRIAEGTNLDSKRTGFGKVDASFFFKWRTTFFPRRANGNKLEIEWGLLKISRITFSIKLDTKHPWMKGIELCWNKELQRFQREINSYIVIIPCNWRFLIIFLSRTTWVNFNQT